jgi:Cu+-exporting ATPase
MSKDPVCGSWVEDQNAPTAEFQGRQYYFCSADCEQEFRDDPERYVGWGGTALSGSA